MQASNLVPSVARKLAAGSARTRCIHSSSVRRAVTSMQMPAMSPTMTEGGIAQWKKRDGESFSAGDVLLEIETDKATIDVEAQEDGIMGKILVSDGAKNIPVGKVIALLAEEGDDISNLEVPKEEPSSAKSTPAPPAEEPPKPSVDASSSSPSTPSPPQDHSHILKNAGPLFPSVHRLLLEHASAIQDPSKITGTGVRGMLTKGDVLAFLGLASNPLGTAKEAMKKQDGVVEKPAAVKKEEPKTLDGADIRRLIVSTMLQTSIRARNVTPATTPDFNSIISDYLPPSATSPSPLPKTSPPPKPKKEDFLDGLY